MPKTSVMPGTPAESSAFQAVAERITELITAFSAKLPGTAPSMVPRKIGRSRWVMQVRRATCFLDRSVA